MASLLFFFFGVDSVGMKQQRNRDNTQTPKEGHVLKRQILIGDEEVLLGLLLLRRRCAVG